MKLTFSIPAQTFVYENPIQQSDESIEDYRARCIVDQREFLIEYVNNKIDITVVADDHIDYASMERISTEELSSFQFTYGASCLEAWRD